MTRYNSPSPSTMSTPTSWVWGDLRTSSDEATGLDAQVLTSLAVSAVCRSEQPISCGLSVSAAGRAPETIGATGDIPVRADWLQQELRQGPDVSAVSSQVVVSKDLAADGRWPDFGRMCVAVLGIRSMVSVAVPGLGIRGTMKYFSAEPAAFDHFDTDAALRFAQLAVPSTAVLVADILAAQAEAKDSDYSRVAVALGIVMARYRVGTSEGFALLSEAARDLGRSLFGVAVEVVQNGWLPEEALKRARLLRGPGAPLQYGSANLNIGGPDMWRNPPGRRVPPAAALSDEPGAPRLPGVAGTRVAQTADGTSPAIGSA